MKALTLWRPWPWAIFHAPAAIAKRIENRPWKPWHLIRGKRIALHAGKHWDAEGAGRILQLVLEGSRPPTRTPEHWVEEGIIGTACVDGYIEDYQLAADLGQGPWWTGPYAWVLSDVRALPRAIPCKGKQGLWTIPPEIEEQFPEIHRVTFTQREE